MEITFSSKQLRKYAISKRAAEFKFGKPLASKLHSCVADILAAECVAELPLVAMVSVDPKAFTIELDGGVAVAFECRHTRELPLVRGTKQIDLTKVRTIMLTDIRVNNDNGK
ncbi:hypothetical protein [Terriglobus sp.]|uniref:hypothetical protein n=1 Tax=Terriglobus sp. TaxID=1889013 RepID=UPI003B004F36